jgi:hypothetical protein
MTPKHLPSFHIAVPYLDNIEHRERLATTLTSIVNQTALRDGSASLTVTVASAGAGSGLDQWLADRYSDVTLDQAPDRGMYDALARVFRGSTADFFGWLGAGDSYESAAFSIAIENAPGNPTQEPYWITGLMQGRRADGAVVRSFLPYRYRRRFFETGLHGTALPTIQQESTFWNRVLQEKIDLAVWATFRLAGDFYLWRTFSQVCEPVVVEAALGAFTWHGDNQSQDYESYQDEVRTVTRPARFWERNAASLERMMWALHPAIKIRLAKGRIRRYAWPEGPWRSC